MSRPFKLKSIRKSQQNRIQYGYAASIGMAATFSALFFAPLGSTFFVWELSRYKRSISKHFISIFVACFIGANITRNIGIGDIIPTVAMPEMSTRMVFMAALVAVVCGVVGALFGTFLRKLERFNERVIRNPFVSVLIGAAAIMLLVLLCGWQDFEGLGGNLLTGALAGHAGTWDFAIKGLLTLLALGFCFKGGEIMPMFIIGSLLGCTMGDVLGISAPFAAMLGLITFFCGATRCPLAAFFMGVEVFGLDAAAYMFVGVLCAYSASFDFGIYGHGAGRELKLRAQSIPRFRRILHYVDGHQNPLPTDGRKPYQDTFDEAADPRRFFKRRKKGEIVGDYVSDAISDEGIAAKANDAAPGKGAAGNAHDAAPGKGADENGRDTASGEGDGEAS